MANREVYVVERRLWEKSQEHEVVAVYSDFKTAIINRDALGGLGGRIKTVQMYEYGLES